jgi:hypothetical protein
LRYKYREISLKTENVGFFSEEGMDYHKVTFGIKLVYALGMIPGGLTIGTAVAKHVLDTSKANEPLISVIGICSGFVLGGLGGSFWWPVAVPASYAYTQKHHPGHWIKF